MILDNAESVYLSAVFEHLDHASEAISGKEFEDCTFKHCNFSNTHFEDCRFIECSFSQCNLSLLNLSSSRIADVHFEQCKMLGIDWTRVHWPQMIFNAPMSFENCALNDSSFFGLELHELRMLDCAAINLDLRQASLRDSDFTGSDFSESVFHQCNLMGVNFSDAINYDINLNHNQLKGAQFNRVEAVRLLDYLDIKLVD